MNRTRLDQIIASYGADPRRWPEAERAEALALVDREGVDLTDARALDALLDLTPAPAAPGDLLQARILRARPTVRRAPAAGWALAACMVMGILVGYGAGLQAPADASAEDMDAIIAMAFEAGGGFDGEVQ